MWASKGHAGPFKLKVSLACAAAAVLWAQRHAEDAAVRAVAEQLCEASFWLLAALTVCNPAALVAEHGGDGLVLPAAGAAWLAVAGTVALLGSPSALLERAWRAMTARFSLFQIAVLGSAFVHMVLSVLLNLWPIAVQNLRSLQRFKIQHEKPPAALAEWWHAGVHIVASQLFVQLPLISGQYFFMVYYGIPYDYDSMPSALDLAWRAALSLVVDDTWVYFGHRALHDRRIYKYIHKVHHIYQSPFAADAEFEHPVETVFLGIGFFTACMLFTNHMVFLWVWLYCRLLVTYDSHMGYDLPWSLFRLFPYYNGAREHDWHHQFFNGNYAPTFTWWDQAFGTNAGFLKHEEQRKAKAAAALAGASAAGAAAGG